jgi:GYF domain 2
MIFFACRIDGTKLGEFEEPDFQAKVSAGQLKSDDYYWHEGMADWRPISDYRLLAKTQRISFTPPPRSTMKIDMDAAEKSAGRESQSRPPNLMSRLRERFRLGR